MDPITVSKDLGRATLQKFDKGRFETTLKYQNYPMCDMLYKKEKIKYSSMSGKTFTSEITLGQVNNGGHVQMFDTDNVSIVDIDKTVTTHWCAYKNALAWHIDEVNINSGDQQIYDLLKSRYEQMYAETADELEEAAWAVPADANDTLNPTGIFWWLVKGDNAGEGFVGYNPYYGDGTECTAGAGGIACSATSNSRWANYFCDYDTLDENMLDKLETAFMKTKFQSPAIVKMSHEGKNQNNFRIFTNSNVIKFMSKFARQADDALGYDLGKYAGNTTYKKLPFEYIPILDTANTNVYGTDPIVGLNFNKFDPYILKGAHFRMSEPDKDPQRHNVLQVFLDLTYNYRSPNRRELGFLLTKI